MHGTTVSMPWERMIIDHLLTVSSIVVSNVLQIAHHKSLPLRRSSHVLYGRHIMAYDALVCTTNRKKH